MKLLMMIGLLNMPLIALAAGVTGTISDGAPDQASLPVTQPAVEAKATGTVARALFTSEIQGREPVDNLMSLSNRHAQLYFFTELNDMQGQRVIHRWQYQGQVMAEVGFDVKGPRWRVWSSKAMRPSWTGVWQVSVVDASGQVLQSEQLELTEASGAAMPAGSEEPATGGTAR